jgi:MOSC N-terminal beta barrel domain
MQIEQLWRYPVKSMQGESLPSVSTTEEINELGLATMVASNGTLTVGDAVSLTP